MATKPAASTSYREAHSALINFLSAFDSLFVLKEKLGEAADAEAMIATQQEHLRVATAQAEAAKAQVEEWQTKAADAKAAHDALLHDLSTDVQKKRNEFNEQVHVAQQERDARLREIEGQFATQEKKARAKMLALDVEISQRTDALNVLNSQVAMVRSEIDTMRRRVAGV